jgi:cytochrome c-type biogenesis protein CcmH/NrfG
VDILNKSIARNPKNPESHYALGWAYQGLGRMPLAVQSYQEALRLNPDHSGAQFKLSLAQAGAQGKSPVPVSTTPSVPVPILED